MRVLRRLGIVVAAVIALPWLAYVVLANGLLMSGAISKLLYSPNSINVTYASGWTLWPGVVHATGFHMVIQDHNIESAIDVGHVDVTIRLRDLTSRVFHATKVRGSGVVFRFRNRVQPGSAHLASVAALPSIPGTESPPVYEAWAPPPPIADKDYHLWTAYLEDVDVQIEELWVEQFRYLGSARAVGAFRLVPARRLWVGPASLELAPGKLVVGPDETLSGFSGRIDCVVHPFDVRVPKGLEVTQYISTHVRLAGDVVSAKAVNLFVPLREPLRIDQHGGRIELDGTFVSGTFESSSHFLFAGDDLDVAKEALAVRLKGPFWLRLTKKNGKGAARAELETTSVYMQSSGVRISGHAKLDVNREAHASREAETSGYRGGLTVSGLEVKSGPGARGWSLDVPSASVAASLDVKDDRVSGPVSVNAKQARLKAGQASAKGDVSVRLRLKTADLAVPTATFDGTADLTNASLATKERWMNDWWGRLKIEAARLKQGSEIDGRFGAKVRDGLPALMVLESEDDIPKWLVGALPRNELEAAFDVSQSCGLTDVEVAHANGSVLEARGRIQHTSGDTHGAVLVKLRRAKILSAGLTISPAHTDWSLLAGDDWLHEKVAELGVHAAAACGARAAVATPDTHVR